MKKFTVDEVETWWDNATQVEREQLVDACIAKIGHEEAYLIMVDAFGSEEKLEQLRAEIERRSSLS